MAPVPRAMSSPLRVSSPVGGYRHAATERPPRRVRAPLQPGGWISLHRFPGSVRFGRAAALKLVEEGMDPVQCRHAVALVL